MSGDAVDIRPRAHCTRLAVAPSLTKLWSRSNVIRTLASSLKVVSIVLLTLAIAGGSVWFFDYWVEKEQPTNIGRAVVFTVGEDEEISDVAENLQDAELIAHPWYFENKMRFGSLELRPGSYNLQVGMSTNQILDTITIEAVPEEGDDATASAGPERPDAQVTFIEGQRIEENAVLVEAVIPGGGAEYIEAAKDIEYWRGAYTFLDDVPAGGSLEGFLFPSTYPVPGNATVRNIIDYQLSEFQNNLTPDMLASWEAQDVSVFEAVTVASIVEREAAVAIERPMIAEVYLNRFKDGTTLNADPSQQYGVGTAENWWPALNGELLEKSKTTPFDTYNREGLPPGPISNPGSASLQAVGQPSTEGYMFFVTRNDDSGEHIFTFTLAEHEAATCEQHPDWEQCQ